MLTPVSFAPVKNSFASDNTTGICPAVMEAVVAANAGVAGSYGSDDWSLRLQQRFSELFETSVTVFTATSGTAANALSLAALTPTYGKVFCHEMSHINTDECGAPEFFTQGAKLVPIPSQNGKISPADLQQMIRGSGNVHSSQPATLSITQSCEVGVVYTLEEINALTKMAHDHGLKVHMDGARFANAIARLGVSPAAMTWQAGVDVLSFGATKNGCLAAEAIIFFNQADVGDFAYLHKRAGQLLSKSRFLAAQLEAYIDNDVWLHNARHANAMADVLSQGLIDFGIALAYPVTANEIFAYLPTAVIAHMNAAGYTIAQGELDETAPPRFVTAWDTSLADVETLLAVIKQAL